MKKRVSTFVLFAALVFPHFQNGFALEPWRYSVDVAVQVDAARPAVVLTWPVDGNARQYFVRRKFRDAQGWDTKAVLPANSTGYTDTTVRSGNSYEYEIQQDTSFPPWPGGDSSQWVSAYSYVYAGVNAPLMDDKGKVLLLVDQWISGGIQNELELFKRDLTGAGWQVLQQPVNREASVAHVKNLIRAAYESDPAKMRSVILIGHIPVPYSGAINPDLHDNHKGAWPADAFYADMDGNWTDHSVSITSSDYPANHNVPGDGKFDQSEIPSPLELEVGRIDFSGLPSFHISEVELLKQYFRKNHAFRHREFTLPRRGLIRDNFGDLDGDAPAVDAWRHFGVFFGRNATREVGPDQFFPILNTEGFLWSYGCGGGGDNKADGVGSTYDFAAFDPRTAFLILHGSWFGDWDNYDNFLRAAIASKSFTLASVWSGLPHWFMHHMALGETIGFSTRVSQNNRSLYKTHQNFAAAQVHVSLIGDPTLEMFPVAPARNLTAQTGNGVSLAWDGSPDESIVGYHVYFSQDPLGPFQRLTSTPLSGRSFTHSIGPGNYFYMVRAIKLEGTGSGTFYNASQGITIQVGNDSTPVVPVVSVAASDGDASEGNGDPGQFRITRSMVTGSSLAINVMLGGTAQNGSDYQSVGNVVVIPAWSGTATVDISPVTDQVVEGSEIATLSVIAGTGYTVGNPNSASITIRDGASNTRPTISQIADQTIAANSSTAELSFTVGDAETAPANLSVRPGSSNEALVPEANIQLSGTGSARKVKVTPVSGQTGVANITLIVSDGELIATRNFYVTVIAANQPPRALDQLRVTAPGLPVALTLGGEDPEGSTLAFALVDLPSKGSVSGLPPSLTYTPNPGAKGIDVFTFKVSDGTANSAPATITIDIIPTCRVLEIKPQNDGTVRLSVELRANRTFKVNASDDAINWQTIGTASSNIDGSGEFIDQDSPGSRLRFYRVEVQ